MTTSAGSKVDQTNCVNLAVMSAYTGVSLGVATESGEGGAKVEFDKVTADGLAYILSHPPRTNAERAVTCGPVAITFAAGTETKATIKFARADRRVTIELDEYEISTLSNMLSQAAKKRLNDFTQFEAEVRLQTAGVVLTDRPEPEPEEYERTTRHWPRFEVTMLK